MNNGISIYKNSYFNDGNEHKIITPEEALHVFDFKIEKEQDHRPNGDPIPGQFHLIRKDFEDDIGRVIGNGVGQEFNVDSQPIDALRFMVDNIMVEMPNLKIETVATTRDGATSFVNFQFEDPFTLPNDKSENVTRLMYINPLCMGSIKLLSHQIRVVCMNTLKRAEQVGTGFKIPHTINSKMYVDAALVAIQNEITKAQELKEISISLDNIRISSKNVEDILNGVYPIQKNKKGEDCTRTLNMRNAVMEQFEKDNSFTAKTGWSFLNAMTYGVQHPKMTAKRDGGKIEIENIYGNRAEQKSKMLNVVMNVLGVA